MKNPVAKNCKKFNLAQKHTDKKKATKKGYQKHTSRYAKYSTKMGYLAYRLFL